MNDEQRDGNLSEVIDRRVQVYGDPVETFVRIAQVWSGLTGFDIQPAQVPLMMIGLKGVRASVSPDYSDNSDDVEGYLDIFRKIVGTDMIHARTVEDYIAQKWPEVSGSTVVSLKQRLLEGEQLMAGAFQVRMCIVCKDEPATGNSNTCEACKARP